MAAQDTDQDQKTEEPTAKRLGEARQEGQLPISREMATFVSLLAAFMVMAYLSPAMSESLVSSLRVFIEAPDQILLAGPGLQAVFLNVMGKVGLACLVVFTVLALGSVLGTMLQTSFFASVDMIKFDIMRLSPKRGLQKLISMQAVAELVRSLLKIIVIGGVGFLLVKPLVPQMPLYTGVELPHVMSIIQDEIVHILAVLLVIVAIIAIADTLYQRHTYFKGLRMTKTEVKDEYKQTEGDPIIKSRLRQIRLEKARKRMIANVPKADVIVTNPTHYAVALKYDNKKMKAPVVIAKGVDQIAKRIREVAEANAIPLVSNPPLARALYDTVELDFPIKTEHYKAVAEIISYVFKLKKKKL